MAGKNVVLFGGSKGGTGKTTVCSNIAVIHHKVLEARGERCVVYDTDKQATLSDWNQLRDSSEHKPHINVVQQLVKAGATLRPTIDYALNEAGYTDVLIDAGGRDNPGLRAAMLCCTKMITPLQVSQFDLWTLEKLIELHAEVIQLNPAIQIFIVLNRASTHVFDKDLEASREFLVEYPQFTVLDTVIHDRTIYRRAASSGLSVVEMVNAAPKAKSEIKSLYAEIFSDEI